MPTELIRLGRRKNIAVEVPEDFKPPLVISYGLGTDSTAVLCMFKEQGIRPDLILFADVGSAEDPNEKPETYAYIPVIQEWLSKVGFPQVTIVRNSEASRYRSLLDNCERQNMLPSLAYGGKSCSTKWKVAAMEKFMNSWIPAQITWARKLQVRRVIGYDASPADMRRCKIAENAKYKYWYPLRDAGITRPECMKIIERNGLPQPGKSACFFCPASKRHEVEDLAVRLPALCARALKLEKQAEVVRGFKTTKGLGRNWNWQEHLASVNLLPQTMELP